MQGLDRLDWSMTVNDEAMTSILWRRLRYMLTPQFDLYKSIAPRMVGLTVMEVGFGTGFGTVQLAQYAEDILAIEADADAVKFARQVLPIGRVTWSTVDITTYNYLQGYFDAVVMVETLEHIADWRKALSNIHGLLKPGGCLYMTARNRNADLRRNELHERELTASELLANLGEFFLDVKLYDYTLTNELTADTHITPLIAVARKAGGHDKDSRNYVSAGWVEGRAEQTHAANVRQAVARVDGGSSVSEQVLN
jgi:2-polyprenyl-3-methyl-5-hydroxy-6-metoxy-1,4-benzoquinol methylase